METLDEYPFFPDGSGALQKPHLLPLMFSAIAEIAQCAYSHLEALSYERTPQELVAELSPYVQRIERCIEKIKEVMK